MVKVGEAWMGELLLGWRLMGVRISSLQYSYYCRAGGSWISRAVAPDADGTVAGAGGERGEMA